MSQKIENGSHETYKMLESGEMGHSESGENGQF